MALSNKYKQIDPGLIRIPEGRQRSGEITTEDLEPSIKARGIYNPIIIREDMTLVAGERRLTAAKRLGLPLVPIRFSGELNELELQIVELEENERRKDLPWMDQVRAIAKLHSIYGLLAEGKGETWSANKTAEMLFYSNGNISKILRVHRDIASPKIANAPGLLAAYNILSRVDERRIGDAMSTIAGAGKALGGQSPSPPGQAPDLKSLSLGVGAGASPPPSPPPAPAYTPAEDSILNVSFLDWAGTYSGPTFNFLHCDFPYGVNLFNGPQSGRDKWTSYDDNPDVYWALIRAFCKHRDKFMSASAHMMFWFSIDFYADTLALFAELAPEIRFFPKPLIWTKTNNVGVLADPKRGPRHIYETCLYASREDRLICQATSDWYGAPTNKDHHPSTKPEPMLRYFMQMFVDEHTTMLDPTCGGGSALRAAESLGAAHVMGLEMDPEYCANARSALKQFRVKEAMSNRQGRA